MPSLGNPKEWNRAWIDELRFKRMLKMRNRLTGYYDFRCFDLSVEMKLSAISERILRGLRNRRG